MLLLEGNQSHSSSLMNGGKEGLGWVDVLQRAKSLDCFSP